VNIPIKTLYITGLTLLTVAAVIFTAVFVRPKSAAEPASAKTEAAAAQEPENVSITGGSDVAAAKPVTESGRREDFFTLLIAGTDEDGTRTDTILLAAIDTAAGTVSVLSIPRDTRAYMASGGVHKINAAHNKGIDRMLTEIENTVGFVPDRYCIIDYSAFETVIDAIGGVTVDVAMDMDYSDPTQDLEIHIQEGEQLLNGEQALHYMRFRSGYADADLGRIRAQQKLIAAVADKLMTPASLALLPKIPELLKKVETDLSAGEVIWLATQLFNLDSEKLTLEMLPGEAVGADYGADEEAVLEVVNERYNPYLEPITALNIP
ncbi:MAG: LCP family protein, partial [Eubacteriales bacterium]